MLLTGQLDLRMHPSATAALQVAQQDIYRHIYGQSGLVLPQV